MMANKKPLTLVLSGVLALSMLSPAALAAEGQTHSDNTPADVLVQQERRPENGNYHEKPNGKPDNGNHNGWDNITAEPGDPNDDDMMVDQEIVAEPDNSEFPIDDDMMVDQEIVAEPDNSEFPIDDDMLVDIFEEEIPGEDYPDEVFVREHHVTGAALADFKTYAEEALDMDLEDYTCDIVKFNFSDDYWVLSGWNDVYSTWSATPIDPANHQPEDVASITLTYHLPWSFEWVDVTIPAEDLNYASYDPCMGLSFAEYFLSDDALTPGDNTGDNTNPDTKPDPDDTTDPEQPGDTGSTVITGHEGIRHEADLDEEEISLEDEETPLDAAPQLPAEEPVEEPQDEMTELEEAQIPLSDEAQVQPVLDTEETMTETVVLTDGVMPMGDLPQTGMNVSRGDIAIAVALSVVGVGLACTGLTLAIRGKKEKDED